MGNFGNSGFAGMPVVVSPFCTERALTRVSGGHQWRWLIRAEVQRPCAYIDNKRGMLYVHPSLVEHLPRRAREDAIGMYRTVAAL